MPKVTVGVPVYNGGDQLRECLECLLAQTFTDIEIRIYDNASSDNTQDIAKEFALRDSRIKYIRHSTNIKAMPNFHRVIQDCTTEFMMWRAHDDLCSPDYIEKLYEGLVGTPSASVAVPTTRSISQRGKVRISTPRSVKGMPRLQAAIRLLFNAHAGWFYGLWRRDALLKDFEECWAAFPHPWALDHLILFPSLLNRTVAIVPEAVFIQRLISKSYSPKKGTKPPVEHMIELRRLFSAQCRRYIERSPYSRLEKLALRLVLPLYVDKRVYKLRKILKRRWIGDKSEPSYGSEF